ncbi:hypothetical protein QKD39_gp53 [Psittacine adenovirus 1]|uniref:Lipase domain-containing protein n=1 Tax=Psittacine adenovirus 1 TaxID=318592 RepID=A0A2Z5E059_9ADEN|nr:hypothetical protein QKD39_gp53 [Psittacine adenovirus 1]AXB73047.1 hypothetical protein [Psittacine adenovirus 1]
MGDEHAEANSLAWFNPISKDFYRFKASEGVYAAMSSAGVFDDGRVREIVLLVHGWQAQVSVTSLFERVLRMHQTVTPRTAVLLLEWDEQGAKHEKYADAAAASVRINLKHFLKDINPNVSKLHCVGHSIGAHACAAICRQYVKLTNDTCARILGLDPAAPLFSNTSPGFLRFSRLSRHDAKYVALLSTNRMQMGLGSADGDEFLSTNLYGHRSEACINGTFHETLCITGYYGQEACMRLKVETANGTMLWEGARLSAHTCDHLIAVIYFVKFLDVRSSPAVFRKMRMSFNHPDGFIPSVWSSYVTSRDYTYDTFYDTETVWYSFIVTNRSASVASSHTLDPGNIVLVVTPKGVPAIISDAVNTQHTTLGGYRFTLGTGFFSYRQVRFLYINSPTKPYIVRLLRGNGYNGKRFNASTMAPMTSFEVSFFTCSLASAVNASYPLYFCLNTNNSVYVPHYRSQLNVTDLSTVVPPTRGCLPFDVELPDLLVIRREVTPLPYGTEIRLRLDFPVFARTRVTLEDEVKNYTLMTFWDRCRDEEPSYLQFSVEMDKKASFRFFKMGNYTVRVYTPYDVTEYPVRVTGVSDDLPDFDGSGMGLDLLRDGGELRGEGGVPPHTYIPVIVAVVCIVAVLVVVGLRFYLRPRKLTLPEALTFNGRFMYRSKDDDWGDDRQVEGESSRLETDG